MQSRFSTFDTEERDDDNLDGRQPHDEHSAQLGGVHEAATVIEAATRRMLHRGLLDWLRRKAQYEESCIAR